jgi:hypothetical protein
LPDLEGQKWRTISLSQFSKLFPLGINCTLVTHFQQRSSASHSFFAQDAAQVPFPGVVGDSRVGSMHWSA